MLVIQTLILVEHDDCEAEVLEIIIIYHEVLERIDYEADEVVGLQVQIHDEQGEIELLLYLMLQTEVTVFLLHLQVEQSQQVDDRLSIRSQQVGHSLWLHPLLQILLSSCSSNNI